MKIVWARSGIPSEDRMEAVKLFDRQGLPLNWEYDDEADTLSLSFGDPRPAVGVDIGDGIIVRYDETAKEVVGLTIIGGGRSVEAHVRGAQ